MNGPLFSKADLAKLHQAVQSLDEVDAMIAKARRCEVNCDVAEAIVGELRRKLTSIRDEFFSNPSALPDQV